MVQCRVGQSSASLTRMNEDRGRAVRAWEINNRPGAFVANDVRYTRLGIASDYFA